MAVDCCFETVVSGWYSVMVALDWCCVRMVLDWKSLTLMALGLYSLLLLRALDYYCEMMVLGWCCEAVPFPSLQLLLLVEEGRPKQEHQWPFAELLFVRLLVPLALP